MKKLMMMMALLFVVGAVCTGCKEKDITKMPAPEGVIGPDGGPLPPPPMENPGPKMPGEK